VTRITADGQPLNLAIDLFESRVFSRRPAYSGPGFDKGGDARVRVFPKSKEILIGCAGSDDVAVDCISAAETEMRERSNEAVGHSFKFTNAEGVVGLDILSRFKSVTFDFTNSVMVLEDR
jgi:hypothetical protein